MCTPIVSIIKLESMLWYFKNKELLLYGVWFDIGLNSTSFLAENFKKGQ